MGFSNLIVLVSLGCPNKNTIDQVAQKKLITHSSGGWEVQDQGPAAPVSVERSLPSLPTAAFSLDPHVAERKRGNKLSCPFL